MTVDLLVVGAGAAGIAAAIEAARAGARVRVLDAAAEAGGTAATSGGGIWVAGSAYQAQLGVEDTADAGLADWLAWGGDAVDVAWAECYVRDSAALFGWLSDLGVGWSHLTHHEGNRAPRWHAPKAGGLGVMQALLRATRDLPIEWQLSTRVTDLILSGGAVRGVRFEGAEGAAEIHAGAVLIASGGFNNNLAAVRRYAPGLPDRLLLGGGTGARGEGHALLERAGAALVNLDSIWIYPFATPDYLDPAGERGLVVRGLGGDIWVNAAGERFHNEAQRGGATGAPALLAQPGATCWSIIDAPIAADYYISDPRYRHGGVTHRDRLDDLLARSPFVASANTLADLARTAGIGPALATTVADHNRRIATADPDPFGRSLAGLRPLDTPPYYAIQFAPLARKNLGGVRTTLSGQVLDVQDQPIPGLLAAGEVAGMAGGAINGRAALEGTMLGPSLYSGRIAGRAASR